jgi:hypothetical protein
MRTRAPRARLRKGNRISLAVFVAIVLEVLAFPAAAQDLTLATDFSLTHFPRADENMCSNDSTCKENHVCTDANFYWFGRHCSSDNDCHALPPKADESLGCIQYNVPRRYINRCRFDGIQRRCVRRWKLSDPAHLTNRTCQKSIDCSSRLTCTSFDSDESRVSILFRPSTDKGKFVCAYLPTRVWPDGTKPLGNYREPAPKWFKSGGPLPANFPKRWDLRRGRLPPAPPGYFWIYAAQPWANICHRGEATPAYTASRDDYFSYVLKPADWRCLDSPDSFNTP